MTATTAPALCPACSAPRHRADGRCWCAPGCERWGALIDPARETCTECGMVANLDPDLHAERYDHAPTVRRGRVVLRWSSSVGDFLPVPMAEYRTPSLVAEYGALRATAWSAEPDRARHDRLGQVVDELRVRGLLDR